MRFLALLALALTACTEPPPKVDDAPPATLKLGVLPAVDKATIAAEYAPLVEEVRAAVGRPVELVVPESYKALEDALLSGDIHVGQLSAHLYTTGAKKRLRRGLATHVLAQERLRDTSQARGVFVVKADSKAKTVNDLRGARVAYVDDGSSSGYFYPRQRLVALGLEPDTFFGAATLAGSHDKVVELVTSGAADVGCISEQRSQTAPGLKVIERSEPIPDDAIVSLGGLSEAEQASIRLLLLGAKDNPRLKSLMDARGIAAWVEPDVEVYLKKPAEP